MAKLKVYGHIKLLDQLVRVQLVKELTNGFKCRLLEDCKCYSAGDLVVMGTGEFIKDDDPNYLKEVPNA